MRFSNSRPGVIRSLILAGLGLVTLIATGVADSRPARAATARRWLAAGDSFSSGHGLHGVEDGDCQRAKGHPEAAWPIVALNSLPANSFTQDFTACSGDQSDKFWIDDVRRKAPRGTGRYDLITLSYGGDDLGFKHVLEGCVWGSVVGAPKAARGPNLGSWSATADKSCADSNSDVRAAIEAEAETYRAFLRRLALEVVAPAGKIVVVGYPELIEEPKRWTGWAQTIDMCSGVNRHNADLLRGWAGKLNQAIGQAVLDINSERINGVALKFVDVNTGPGTDHFEPTSPSNAQRHNLCAQEEWLFGVSLVRGFHPNRLGHLAMGGLVGQVIGGLDWSVSPDVVALQACASDCSVTGKVAAAHPNWGPVSVETLVDSKRRGHIYIVDEAGTVRWAKDLNAVFEALAPNDPVTDSTGNLFISYNPGRLNGIIVLRFTPEGVNDFGSTDLQKFYSGETADANSDGQLEIVMTHNDCVPDCAGGKHREETLYWTAGTYLSKGAVGD